MWLALGLASLGISTAAIAGTNSWTDVGPDGGNVAKVIFHPTVPDTLFAMTYSGLYRSQDAGGSWQLLSEGTPNADLAIDPNHPDRIFRAAATQLLVSNDGGVTFAPLVGFPVNAGASQIEMSTDGMTLYVSSFDRVFQSTDAGSTWTERAAVSTAVGGAAVNVQQLLIDPADPATVYALANTSENARGIFLSEDGAASWQLVSSSTSGSDLISQLAASANPRRLWSTGESNVSVSTDQGRHFSPVIGTPSWLSVTVDPTNADNVYAGRQDGKVFRTENAGAAWVDVTGNLSQVELPVALFINPARPMEVFVAGTAGMARTTSGGLTWALRQTGISAARVEGFSANAARDRIYIRSNVHGVQYLESGAPRAVQMNIDALLQAIHRPQFAYVSALHTQEGMPGRLFAGTGEDFLRSVDDGNSWQPMTLPITGRYQVVSITSSPGAPDTLFAATGFNGAFRSEDGGDHWVAASTGLPENVLLQQVEAARTDPHTVYTVPSLIPSGGSGLALGVGVYRWTDAAAKWEPVNTGIENEVVSQIAVDPSDAQVVYAAGNGGLWKTVNGGETWSSLPWSDPPSGAYAVAIDPVDPRIIYAAGGGAPRRSVDGTNWETLEDPSRAAGTYSPLPGALIVDPGSPDTVLVGTSGSGVQRFTVSSDLVIEATSTPAASAAPGTSLAYEFTVRNNGKFATTDTRVRLQVPAKATGISAQSSSPCTVMGANVACELGALRAGLSSVVTLSVLAQEVGQFAVTAEAEARQPDPVATNNSTTVTTAIAQPSAPVVPPAAGGNGGGGVFSPFWLLILALIVVVRSNGLGAVRRWWHVRRG
jgi:hypothetical protein